VQDVVLADLFFGLYRSKKVFKLDQQKKALILDIDTSSSWRKKMFFKKNKNSQPAATVHQSTLGVSEMSDDDLIAVTGGVGSSYASSGSSISLGSSVLGTVWSSSAAASTSSTSGAISPTGNSSLLGLIVGGKRAPLVSLRRSF
jgi:hypothetical protein